METKINADEKYKQLVVDGILKIREHVRLKNPHEGALELLYLVSCIPDQIDKSEKYEKQVKKIFEETAQNKSIALMSPAEKRTYHIKRSQNLLSLLELVKKVTETLKPMFFDFLIEKDRKIYK